MPNRVAQRDDVGENDRKVELTSQVVGFQATVVLKWPVP
jgi:hypothetical protein